MAVTKEELKKFISNFQKEIKELEKNHYEYGSSEDKYLSSLYSKLVNAHFLMSELNATDEEELEGQFYFTVKDECVLHDEYDYKHRYGRREEYMDVTYPCDDDDGYSANDYRIIVIDQNSNMFLKRINVALAYVNHTEDTGVRITELAGDDLYTQYIITYRNDWDMRYDTKLPTVASLIEDFIRTTIINPVQSGLYSHMQHLYSPELTVGQNKVLEDPCTHRQYIVKVVGELPDSNPYMYPPINPYGVGVANPGFKVHKDGSKSFKC